MRFFRKVNQIGGLAQMKQIVSLFFHPNVEVGKDSLAAPSPSSSVAPA